MPSSSVAALDAARARRGRAAAAKPVTSASAAPRSRAPSTIAAASGCSLAALEARREPRARSGSSTPGSRSDAHEPRPALGERAGLVHDQRVGARERLERLGALHQHARARRRAPRRPGSTSASRGRARRGRRRSAPRRPPRARGRRAARARARATRRRRARRQRPPPGTNQRRDRVGQALDRRAAALRLGHERHDPRQQRVAAGALGAHHEAAGAVERRADRRARPGPSRPASARR